MGGRGSYSNNTKGGMRISAGGAPPEGLLLAGMTKFTGGNKVSIQATATSIESKNKALGHEVGVVIGADGFAMIANKGDAHSVGFTYDQIGRMKGQTLTHNHPDKGYGGTFSEADVKMFHTAGLKEMRASGKEGTYVLKTTGKADTKGFAAYITSSATQAKVSKGMTTQAAKVAAKRASYATKAEYEAASRKAQVDVLHRVYQRAAKQYGLTYTFTKAK